MKNTRGGRLLVEWLKSERRTQDWLALEIDTHQTNISAWVRGVPGRAIPLEKAILIRDITGIQVDEWTVEEAPKTEAHPSE